MAAAAASSTRLGVNLFYTGRQHASTQLRVMTERALSAGSARRRSYASTKKHDAAVVYSTSTFRLRCRHIKSSSSSSLVVGKHFVCSRSCLVSLAACCIRARVREWRVACRRAACCFVYNISITCSLRAVCLWIWLSHGTENALKRRVTRVNYLVFLLFAVARRASIVCVF